MLSFMLKLVLAALAFGCGLYAAHHWDAGNIETLHAKIAAIERDDARATASAVTDAANRMKRADAISLNAAVAEAGAQQKLADQKLHLLQEVRLHVSPRTRLCIPYGLVRLLDAASLGADPDALSLCPQQI